MNAINDHEQQIARKLYNEIQLFDKLKIIGPEFGEGERAPTISFVHDSLSAIDLCRIMADNNITAWDGHFYAQKAMQVLGLEERGGVTRLGISLYNTENDIDYVIEVLKSI